MAQSEREVGRSAAGLFPFRFSMNAASPDVVASLELLGLILVAALVSRAALFW